MRSVIAMVVGLMVKIRMMERIAAVVVSFCLF